MPNRSSLARTAASPPLRPKMNVPARLRTRISVGSKPCGTSISQKHVPISRPTRNASIAVFKPGVRTSALRVDASGTPGRRASRHRIVERSASMTESTHDTSALAGLDAIIGDLEDLYRDVHEHPELSLQEHRTADKAAER